MTHSTEANHILINELTLIKLNLSWCLKQIISNLTGKSQPPHWLIGRHLLHKTTYKCTADCRRYCSKQQKSYPRTPNQPTNNQNKHTLPPKSVTLSTQIAHVLVYKSKTSLPKVHTYKSQSGSGRHRVQYLLVVVLLRREVFFFFGVFA